MTALPPKAPNGPHRADWTMRFLFALSAALATGTIAYVREGVTRGDVHNMIELEAPYIKERALIMEHIRSSEIRWQAISTVQADMAHVRGSMDALLAVLTPSSKTR